MGAVYLASMDALGGKKVAIKEMEVERLKPTELDAALKQFRVEATFLANLEHPNLVAVTDFFAEESRNYLVMAYVDGEPLDQKLRAHGQPFSWAQVRPWALSLCEVLHYLHTRTPTVLFRDLKPSNIMLDAKGTLKLIDFGIARVGDPEARTSTFLHGTGTSGFSPIEQYGGANSTDARSDIYSLGATLYHLLTGQVPADAAARSSGTALRRPSLLQAELSPEIDALVMRALAQAPKDRFQTIAEMRDALDGSPTSNVPPTPTQVAPLSQPPKIRLETFPTQLRPKAGALTWLIAAASLLAAAMTVATLLDRQPSSKTSTLATSSPPPLASPSAPLPQPRPAPKAAPETATSRRTLERARPALGRPPRTSSKPRPNLVGRRSATAAGSAKTSTAPSSPKASTTPSPPKAGTASSYPKARPAPSFPTARPAPGYPKASPLQQPAPPATAIQPPPPVTVPPPPPAGVHPPPPTQGPDPGPPPHPPNREHQANSRPPFPEHPRPGGPGPGGADKEQSERPPGY